MIHQDFVLVTAPLLLIYYLLPKKLTKADNTSEAMMLRLAVWMAKGVVGRFGRGQEKVRSNWLVEL